MSKFIFENHEQRMRLAEDTAPKLNIPGVKSAQNFELFDPSEEEILLSYFPFPKIRMLKWYIDCLAISLMVLK